MKDPSVRRAREAQQRRAELFVLAWQTEPNLASVCARTGMTPRCASNRAGWYRKRGVPLRRFPRACRGGPGFKLRLDWERLKAVAEGATA